MQLTPRFEIHSHTMYSNIRLLDSINRPKALIDRAIELGLSGLAVTDHDALCSHVKVNQYAKEIAQSHPNFKIALGNEIYLCENREMNQRYFHFILIAKNKQGYQALKKLSSRAWMNSYYDRGMERVVTTYADLEEMVSKYPDSLIATTACLGGQLSVDALALVDAQAVNDLNEELTRRRRIFNFVNWCKKLFGEDFYIECAPAASKDQIKVNKELVKIARDNNVKMVLGTDAHYLKKEDRFVHEAYLNSKGGEREVASFYEYAYLQSEDEIIKNIAPSELDYDTLVKNSYEIYEKIENFSLEHKQVIPKVKVKDYPVSAISLDENKYPTLVNLIRSEDPQDRYWVNECYISLLEKEHNKDIDETKHDIYMARLEEEADIKSTIGKKLETNMFSYPNTLQHYINLFWKCGSMVGAGRGSSCSGLNHYLMGITQLDPIKWELPFWRYLNKERTELGDIDLDLCPSKRPRILKKIKKERGQNFNKDVDELSRKNLGCTLIATFGTEGTRSAVLTACRGYRSIDCPDGIDVDTAQYIASLIPQERGFLWPLVDVINGNKDKNRKPNKTFINEVSQYPGLLDIMLGIEGLVNKRSSHASGVIMFDEDPYEFGCFMKTPKGEIITQWDLHDSEYAGMTKYDFLVTEVQDKLVECIELLQKHEAIESNLSLREVYNKYFYPEKLPIEDENIWKVLHKNNVLNIFQFDSDVGGQAAKKIKPSSILEMSDANGLMRLMTAEKGQESPMDKYIRFKSNIDLWYKEMDRYGLTEEEQKTLEPYFLRSYGVPPSQEQMMMMLMDNDICGFSLAEANAARKIVGKKLMSKVPELKAHVLTRAKSKQLGEYVWAAGIGPQMGYSFSVIHALAYSFIGFQTMYIATKWNPIYWNTACLIVNSGALEEDNDAEYEIEETEDGEVFRKKERGTDYTKIAKALGDIISRNIKVSLVDINKSSFTFEPDAENNQILFGMKALSGINTQVIEKIIAGRPYASFKDFLIRCPLNKTQMFSLIKSGAFDSLEETWAKELKVEPRMLVMVYYISIISEPKKKLTLQNFNGLLQRDLVPDSLDFVKKIFEFNKYLKIKKFIFDEACLSFYSKHFSQDDLSIVNGRVCIDQKVWDKKYKSVMAEGREWLTINQEDILSKFNKLLFMEQWDKYAKGTISAWEMESMCFYYHGHELANVDVMKYGISNFFNLPEEPEVDYYFKRNNRQIPIYKISRIVGTVIGKNDAKSSISLLTTNGVVNVKFTKEYFALYNRQLSEPQADGTKKIIEKGWFKRGTKVMVCGFRRDDTFVAKKYAKSVTHQLYKIVEVNDNGDIKLVHDRGKGV